MRLLLVGAGASVSVKDVSDGYDAAFRELGCEVHYYALAERLGVAERHLRATWKAMGSPPFHRYTAGDVAYTASTGIIERALDRQGEWVVVISGMYLHQHALRLARRAGIRVAVIFTESPYDDPYQAHLAAEVDRCWTNERTSVAALRKANPTAAYLPPAYDPVKHRPMGEADPDVAAHDVVFVGTGFPERTALLRTVDWTGIDLGIYGIWDKRQLGKARQYVRGGTVDNRATAALYRHAKIGLNLYRRSAGLTPLEVGSPQVDHAQSMNPRAYELAACGVFHLSDERPEVREVFGPAVPTFRTAEQLGELLRRYLADEAARREHAAAARQAIAPHTFAARAAQVLADLAGHGASALTA